MQDLKKWVNSVQQPTKGRKKGSNGSVSSIPQPAFAPSSSPPSSPDPVPTKPSSKRPVKPAAHTVAGIRQAAEKAKRDALLEPQSGRKPPRRRQAKDEEESNEEESDEGEIEEVESPNQEEENALRLEMDVSGQHTFAS